MTTAPASVLDAAAFGRKTAALLAARSQHLPRVRDVTALAGTLELVLEAPTGPTLTALLAHRRRVRAGEAVTIVIGVVRAVAALHEAGFCAIELGDDAVCFDSEGCPVLSGLDALGETIQAGAAGPAGDWRRVSGLADRLGLVAHGRIGGALGPAQVGLGLALAAVAAHESETALEGLEDALFDIAEPIAVQLSGAAEAGATRVSAARRSPRREKASHRSPSASRVIEAFEAGPAALLSGPRERLRELLRAAGARLTGRVRLAVIGGSVAAVLTVAAVALMPPAGSAASIRPGPHGDTAPTAGAASKTAMTQPVTTPTGAAGRSAAALTGADPVAAAPVLLAERDACLGLSGAAQTGCFAAVADGAASALAEPARPLAGLAPSLIERTGATALIALAPRGAKTAPASALMMRTEAGWRLRQLYEN